jgi:hypothetical protein
LLIKELLIKELLLRDLYDENRTTDVSFGGKVCLNEYCFLLDESVIKSGLKECIMWLFSKRVVGCADSEKSSFHYVFGFEYLELI